MSKKHASLANFPPPVGSVTALDGLQHSNVRWSVAVSVGFARPASSADKYSDTQCDKAQ